ncbi:ribonuclease H protein, partial [Trifolium medium]|nr:ribonuclease H protein [Trifolium medium]
MDNTKMCCVGWDCVCQPKEKGGLGIKNLELFNSSLLSKWKWRCLNDLSAPWYNLLSFRYGSFAANILYGDGRERLKHESIWWRDIWKTGGVEEGGWLGNNISSVLGDGNDIDFWKEKWLGMVPLCDLYPSLYNKTPQQDAHISDMGIWDSNIWLWKLNWAKALDDSETETALELQQMLEQVRPNRAVGDRRRWLPNTDGFFSVRSAYKALQNKLEGAAIDSHIVAALNRLWKNNVPSKVSIFGWWLLLKKLPTREALYRK